MTSNWADLPRDIVEQIFNRLSLTSYSSFKLVCKSWYFNVREAADLSILYPIKSPPWLAVPLPLPDSKKEQGNEDNDFSSRSILYFNFVNKKVLFDDVWRFPTRTQDSCVGSCHGWLAFLNTRCVLYLKNPFKPIESSLIQLPPIDTLPCILSTHLEFSPPPPSLVIVDFMYYHRHSNTTSKVSSNELYPYFVSKLVMSSSPNDSSCIVMIIYGHPGNLAYCKIGDTSWTKLDGKLLEYDDIYYSSEKKQFYVLCENGFSFETWDLEDLSSSYKPRSTLFCLPKCYVELSSHSSDERKIRYLCDQKAYLGESHNGDLLWVVKYFTFVNADIQHVDLQQIYRTYRFDVYKLNWMMEEWAQVNSLDEDGVLFLGINNAMAFSANDFPCLQRNSIYFVDDCISYNHGRHAYSVHDVGVLSLEDNVVGPCYNPIDSNPIDSPHIWITPW